MQTKTCTKCLRTLLLGAFHRQKHGRLRRQSVCKMCMRRQHRVRRGLSPNWLVLPSSSSRMKRCPRCGRVKSLSHFGLNQQTRDRLQSWCKACNSEGARKRRRARALLDPAAIVCRICGAILLKMNAAHLKAHHLTVAEYRLAYPDDDLVSSNVSARIGASVKTAWAAPEVKAKTSGDNNHMWRGGLDREDYSPEFDKALKKTIRERDAGACVLCGIGSSECELHVHHVDYNKHNCELCNLVSLCPPHHSATTAGDREAWTVELQLMLADRYGYRYPYFYPLPAVS